MRRFLKSVTKNSLDGDVVNSLNKSYKIKRKLLVVKYTGVVGILIPRCGKFIMEKLKSFLLS
jgi:hypothetical protein